jgi:hypothetical protein
MEFLMKITKRQLRRIIREAIHDSGNDAFIDTLIFGWENVRSEVEAEIPNPTLRDKGDEAMAWVSANEPDIARQINTLSTHNLRALFAAAFDPASDRDHKTSAMDWNR